MKLKVKELANRFIASFSSKSLKMRTAAWIVSIIIGVVIATFLFSRIDTTRASDSDFEPLRTQAINVLKDNNLINAYIDYYHAPYVQDGMIFREFENDECSIIAKYESEMVDNQNRITTLVGYEKIDKYVMPYYLSAAISCLVGFIACMYLVCILPYIFEAIVNFAKFIKKKLTKHNIA